jgi:hypothetical protein
MLDRGIQMMVILRTRITMNCFQIFFFKLSTFQANELNEQLENWLSKANYSHGPAKAIISPYFKHFQLLNFK